MHQSLKKKILLTTPLLLSQFLFGCASVTSGHNQSVSVDTGKEQGAMCSLTNDKGTWHVPTTPGSVTVHRAYGDLTVNCKKDDKVGATTVTSSTKGLAFGNIIMGGVVGAAVDVGTGAAYDYPTTISVALKTPGERDIEPTGPGLDPAATVATSQEATTDSPQKQSS